MNKKLVIGCIGLVVMLICLTAFSAVTAQKTNDEVKNSPLFNLRASSSIDKDISTKKISFLNNRIYVYFASSNQYSPITRNMLFNKDTFLDQTTCAGTDTCNPRKQTCMGPTCSLTCAKITVLCGSCTQNLICKTLRDER